MQRSLFENSLLALQHLLFFFCVHLATCFVMYFSFVGLLENLLRIQQTCIYHQNKNICQAKIAGEFRFAVA